MTKSCLNDGKKFKAKRADARFCSNKCRVAYGRKNNIDLETGEVMGDPLPAIGTEGPVGHAASRKLPLSTSVENGLVVGVDPAKPGSDKSVEQVYDREANLKAFIKMGVAKVNWISTGLPEFDALTKIPRGRITQIQGPYGVGKTTLCLNMIKGLRGHKILYIDTEAALVPELLADLQIEAKNFTLYNESAYMEDIAEVIRDAAKSGKYELIILDSVPMTSTKTIADSDITASNIGQKAKVLHKLMEWIAMDLKKTDTAMVFINQEREMIGTYVPTKYTPGGTAIPFQASLIVALKSIKSWRFPQKPTDGIYKGQEVEATIIKSKVNTPWRVAKFKIYYPTPQLQEQDGQLSSRPAF